MLKLLLQNITSKHRQEKFIREVKTNGLLTAIKKAYILLRQLQKPLSNQLPNIDTKSYFAQLFQQAFKSESYIPFRINQIQSLRSEIKLIAFYLPQFHPIKENDEWWGKGFTEWTNVTKAVPQFLGHYQPHLPDVLGFYDLRLKEVQQQQITLAKQYGIYGFCYHHYWFNKKKVLETPLETVLNNPDLDFPFCINWANQNWTRRWDGLEQDILLAQQHSAEDDIAFIADSARYMRDPRYIRIEGKPLLILYRPGLLPDARATAMRWRKWCRENSIGEIFLALTHAFEHTKPNEIGFDAAIEYAPNTYPVKPITQQIIASGKMINPLYQGNIYDYNEAASIGQSQIMPSYKKFRGLFPGWDNEARIPGRGTTYIDSSPLRFHQWLATLISLSQKQFKPSEQFIFINAWNEWAEGAHLEPDRKFGFSFLESCRIAQQLEILSQQKNNLISQENCPKVAIVIHAYYPDIFDEILANLSSTDKYKIKLFITTPSYQVSLIENRLISHGMEYQILGVNNQGRDIFPLIKILKEIYQQHFSFIVKVHTKKSKHRTDGTIWRKDLFFKLLTKSMLEKNIQYLVDHPEVGILAPEGHLVPMNHYIAANEKAIIELSARLGVEMETVMKLHFVAGTMFTARIDALLPLLTLSFEDTDFGVEKGQLDGTLAHALERLISIGNHRIGYQIRTLSGQTTSHYAHADVTSR